MATKMGGDHAERGPGEPEGRVSDDVRERSEAVDAVALLFAKRRQPAPTMDGAHQPNPAEIKAAQEAVEIVRAALAVAPATAQPGAWQRGHRPDTRHPISVEVCETSDLVDDDVVFHDGEWWVILDHPENDGRQVYAAPIIDDAGGQDEPDFIESTWFVRVVPLYAAPPATGDAAAVREAVRGAVREACMANERDRTVVARSLTAFDKAIAGRRWLTEGRGPYEWDDDRYRLEFGHAIDEFRAAVEPLRAVARDMTNCPTNDADIQAAKAAARALPLPAPATAVEEAISNETARCAAVVQELAGAGERDGNDAVGMALRLAASRVRRTGKEHESARLVREAERAATHAPATYVHDGTCCTNAAGMPNCYDPPPEAADEGHTRVEESRSDDSPAKGQGGV